jgi:PAS domain-containing protein
MHGCEVHLERTVSAIEDSCPRLQDAGGRAQRWVCVFTDIAGGRVNMGCPISRPDLSGQWQQQEGEVGVGAVNSTCSYCNPAFLELSGLKQHV